MRFQKVGEIVPVKKVAVQAIAPLQVVSQVRSIYLRIKRETRTERERHTERHRERRRQRDSETETETELR